jgi:hypothetical protein
VSPAVRHLVKTDRDALVRDSGHGACVVDIMAQVQVQEVGQRVYLEQRTGCEHVGPAARYAWELDTDRQALQRLLPGVLRSDWHCTWSV